jgi:hypothetical protein
MRQIRDVLAGEKAHSMDVGNGPADSEVGNNVMIHINSVALYEIQRLGEIERRQNESVRYQIQLANEERKSRLSALIGRVLDRRGAKSVAQGAAVAFEPAGAGD